MLMETAFLRYTDVGSDRDVSIAGKGGRSRVDAPSMFMAMYSHLIGKNAQFGFRAMLSLDPLIERGYGYPLLYQTGETYRGEPIHDRQHPHVPSDRKSTRLNSSHVSESRMPSSA